MDISEMIAVLQAAKDGKQIEHRKIGQTIGWSDAFPLWDFSMFDYRVKPGPKEYWIVMDQGGAPVQVTPYRINAERSAEGWPNSTVIHVREVLE